MSLHNNDISKKVNEFKEDFKAKIKPTPMFKRYFVRFCFRALVFLFVFYMYLFHHDWFYNLVFDPVIWKFSFFHVLWLIFMLIMIMHIFPNRFITMAQRKSQDKNFDETKKGYDELELLRFVQDQNQKAWKVMLSWLCVNAVIGVLFLTGAVHESFLWLCVVFFYCSDSICIMFFCPFQSYIMKNRCCVNCRIFDWGHFMMFTPLIFIKGFFSWSLFFTACVVLIKWEITYASHPERFWNGSNANLKCSNCKDRMCQVKKAYLPKRINQWQDIELPEPEKNANNKN